MHFWASFLCFIIFCSTLNSIKGQEPSTSTRLEDTRYRQSKSLELLHVLTALTPYSNTTELLNKESEEYEKVMRFFKRFEHFKVVKKIHRALLKEGYPALALEFIQHDFESNSLKKSAFINKNFYELQYFIKESNFFTFLEVNANLFKKKDKNISLKNSFKSFSNWFEAHTQQKHESYIFIVSPLIKKTYLFKPSKSNKLDQALFIGASSVDKINFHLFELNVQLYLSKEFKVFNKRIVHLIRSNAKKWKSEAPRFEKWESIQLFNTYLSALLYEIYVIETSDLNYIEHQKEVARFMAINAFDAYPRFRRKGLELWKDSQTTALPIFFEKLLLSLETGW